MKTNPLDWVQWDTSEILPFEGGTSFLVRSDQEITVKDSFGLLLGMGAGEIEVEVTGSGNIHFHGASDVHLKPRSRIQERIAQSEVTFTSLDRPAPLTPEMAAIQRMMRKNELDRERDRQIMEQRFNDQQSRSKHRPEPGAPSPMEVPSGKGAAKPKKAVVKDPARGAADPDRAAPAESGSDAQTAGTDEGDQG